MTVDRPLAEFRAELTAKGVQMGMDQRMWRPGSPSGAAHRSVRQTRSLEAANAALLKSRPCRFGMGSESATVPAGAAHRSSTGRPGRGKVPYQRLAAKAARARQSKGGSVIAR